MVIQRGEVWWAEMPASIGAEPGYRRPVVIVQADPLTASRMATVVAVIVTSTMRWANSPGNVLLRADECGLSRDSVANVTQIVTLDKRMLDTRIGKVRSHTLEMIDNGLRFVLNL